MVLVTVLGLYAVSYTVRWQEQALVLRFSKIVDVVNVDGNDAGLHWRSPVDKVVKFDTRIRTLVRPDTQTQTSDAQNIIVTLFCNWRVSDVETLYKTFHSGRFDEQDIIIEAEKQLRQFLGEAGNIFTEYKLNELISLNSERFALATLTQSQEGGLLERVNELLSDDGAGYGIEVVSVGIKKLGVPDNVTEKVFERMTAERQEQITKLTGEGESQRDSLIANAESEANEIRTRALSEANDIRGKGDAEAAEFYGVFLKYPRLYDLLQRLKTLDQTVDPQTTLVLDSRSEVVRVLIEGPEMIDQAFAGQGSSDQALTANEQ